MTYGVAVYTSVKETQRELEDALAQAILEHLGASFRKVAIRLEKQFQQIIKKAIEDEPEYQSLLGGILRADLGLDQAAKRVTDIVDTFIRNIRADNEKLTRFGKTIKGGIKIILLDGDYSAVTNHPNAIIRPEKTEPFNWVEWMLIKGDQVVVLDYHVSYRTGAGRSEMAIMRKRGKWRYPIGSDGVGGNYPNDNWFTRAINKASKQIEQLIYDNLRAEI